MNAVYVYAFLGERLRSPQVMGRHIEIRPLGDIYAAIERFDPPPVLSEAALRRQHDIVVRLARRVDAIIPARFGSLVDSDELERIVRLRHDVFLRTLQLVRGKVQMTVRMAAASEHTEALPALQQHTGRTGITYLRARRAALAPPQPQSVDMVCRSVADLTVDVRVSRDDAGTQRIINHLIDRHASRIYRRRVSAVRDALPDVTGLTITGPWPPFAFAPELWP